MNVQRNSNVATRRIGSSWVILENNRKYVRTLNSTAGYIWSLAKIPIDLSEIEKRVVQKYNVLPDVAHEDVGTFVREYLKNGLLVTASNS